jgi:hypothetical protein
MNLFKKFLKTIISSFGYQISRVPVISFSDLPVNYSARSLAVKSDTDFESDLEYAISVGENYVKDIIEADIDIVGKEILEIGPGVNFGSALIFNYPFIHDIYNFSNILNSF